ncbi:hypothetical protein KC319_g4204 [Hortaea werneckii]|nr:hypothetical protein KC319_g4204 [Hortaea werneckii]
MSAALTTDVDERLLRTTKFPPEFNKKVDTTKVNSGVITGWAAGELKRILGDVDEILSGLVTGFIQDNRYPNIKKFQIYLAGFLDKETPEFCQHLWNLLLSAQESETGVPQELLEVKKQELINERIEEERQRKEAQKQQDAERERERNMARIRARERGGPNRRGDAVRIPMYLAVTARDAVRPPSAVRHPATEARRDVDAGARQTARAPHRAEAVTAARHPASAEVTDGVDATAKDTGPAPL